MSLDEFKIHAFFFLKLQQQLFIDRAVTLLCIWVSTFSASLVLCNEAATLGDGR